MEQGSVGQEDVHHNDGGGGGRIANRDYGSDPLSADKAIKQCNDVTTTTTV